MNKVFKNFSILTISNLLQQFINFLCLARITRILSVNGFGLYVFILTVVNIFLVISSLGLRQILIREIAINENAIPKIVRLVFKIIAVSLACTSVVLFFYLHYLEGITSLSILSFSIVLLISLTFWNVFEAVFLGKQLMHYSANIGIIFSSLWFLAIFLIPASALNSVKFVILIWTFINLGKIIILLFLEFRRGYFKIVGNSFTSNINLCSILKYSFPVYGAALLALPVNQFPILFLNMNSEIKEIAFFSVGNKVLMPLALVSANLFNALFPNFSNYYEEDKDKYAQRIINTFKLVLFINIFISTVLCFYSPEIIISSFGSNYRLASYSFVLQIWIMVNLIAHSFMGVLFVTSKYENLLFRLSVFNAVVIGLFNYLGSFLGAKGLATFLLIGVVISFLVHTYFINKRMKINLLKSNLSLFIIYICQSFISFFILSIDFFFRTIFVIIFIICLIYFNKIAFLTIVQKIQIFFKFKYV